eukprot:TRINITY_DN17611_c0_g1_i1.p1 TRINITY_DN17611_c0_g1~~TRINITY_DN17611_c0_g1_i1.p1  ORF type:complete len:1025 (-),score=136.00 TRINITY_DN17611_c0_g1_i1:36-2936(-)
MAFTTSVASILKTWQIQARLPNSNTTLEILCGVQAISSVVLVLPCSTAFDTMTFTGDVMVAEWSTLWRLFPVVFTGICAWMATIQAPVFHLLLASEPSALGILSHLSNTVSAVVWIWFIYRCLLTMLLNEERHQKLAILLLKIVCILRLITTSLALVLSPQFLVYTIKNSPVAAIDVLYFAISAPTSPIFFLLCSAHIQATGLVSHDVGYLSAQIYNRVLLLPFRYMDGAIFMRFLFAGCSLITLDWAGIVDIRVYGTVQGIVTGLATCLCVGFLIKSPFDRKFVWNPSTKLVLAAAMLHVVIVAADIWWSWKLRDNLTVPQLILEMFGEVVSAVFALVQAILLSYRGTVMWFYLFNFSWLVLAFADFGIKLIMPHTQYDELTPLGMWRTGFFLALFWTIVAYEVTVMGMLPLPNDNWDGHSGARQPSTFVESALSKVWQVTRAGIATPPSSSISNCLVFLGVPFGVVGFISTLAKLDICQAVLCELLNVEATDLTAILALTQAVCIIVLIVGPVHVFFKQLWAAVGSQPCSPLYFASTVDIDNLWRHYSPIVTVLCAWLTGTYALICNLDGIRSVSNLQIARRTARILEELCWIRFEYLAVQVMLFYQQRPPTFCITLHISKVFTQTVVVLRLAVWATDLLGLQPLELFIAASETPVGFVVSSLFLPGAVLFYALLFFCLRRIFPTSSVADAPPSASLITSTSSRFGSRTRSFETPQQVLLVSCPAVDLRAVLRLLFFGCALVTLNVFDYTLWGYPKLLVGAVTGLTSLYCFLLVAASPNRVVSYSQTTVLLVISGSFYLAAQVMAIAWLSRADADHLNYYNNWSEVTGRWGVIAFTMGQTLVLSFRRTPPLQTARLVGNSYDVNIPDDLLRTQDEDDSVGGDSGALFLGLPWLYTLNFACIFLSLASNAHMLRGLLQQKDNVSWLARLEAIDCWSGAAFHSVVLSLFADFVHTTRTRREGYSIS